MKFPNDVNDESWLKITMVIIMNNYYYYCNYYHYYHYHYHYKCYYCNESATATNCLTGQ